MFQSLKHQLTAIPNCLLAYFCSKSFCVCVVYICQCSREAITTNLGRNWTVAIFTECRYKQSEIAGQIKRTNKKNKKLIAFVFNLLPIFLERWRFENFASLLKKHFIALRCEHQTMKRKNSLRKTSFYLLSFFIGERAQGRKIKSVINTIRQEQYWWFCIE